MLKGLYKTNFDLKASQEERRQCLLKKQKDERRNLQDTNRLLEESLLFALEEEPVSNVHKPNNKSRGNNWRQKQQEKLKNTFHEIHGVELSLQQSEWLRECPSNMCDWLLVPCPRGQRSLVVAHNRQTIVYNKVGRCVCTFRSMLPGDCSDSSSITILDCVYSREQDVFYVLDVLVFGGTHNLLYCEAEFRFFWLHSKWAEMDFLEHRSASNQKPFHLVKQYDFENKFEIAEAFQRYPLWSNNKPELDGFLFYHRFANYTCGTTPLVGWLFAYMVSDVLNMQVNEQYVKPVDYIDPFSYMDQFDQRLKVKWRRSQEREGRRGRGINTEVDNVDSQPIKQSNQISIDGGCKHRVNDSSNCEENDNLRCDDVNPESDDENSLKKLLKTQRDLEMEPNTEEII